MNIYGILYIFVDIIWKENKENELINLYTHSIM
jgi:hypothetical protein